MKSPDHSLTAGNVELVFAAEYERERNSGRRVIDLFGWEIGI
jgi:hypothetical protein